jgi:hypothetical protein
VPFTNDIGSNNESIETIASLKDTVERLTEQRQRNTLTRLQATAGAMAELMQMETALRLYAMALRRMSVQERQVAEPGYVLPSTATSTSTSTSTSMPSTSTPATAPATTSNTTSATSSTGFMSEKDRQAVIHRASALEQQAEQLAARADSIHKELEENRMVGKNNALMQ